MGNANMGFTLGDLSTEGDGEVKIVGAVHPVKRWDVATEPFEVVEKLQVTHSEVMDSLYAELYLRQYEEYLRRVSILREEGFFSHKKVVYVHRRYSPQSTVELEHETPERFGRSDWFARLKWANNVFPTDEDNIERAYGLYGEIMSSTGRS